MLEENGYQGQLPTFVSSLPMIHVCLLYHIEHSSPPPKR